MFKAKRIDKPYEIRIKAHKNWFYFDWQDLIHHRDLLFLLVRRDFVSRFQQTILGPAWFFIQPVLTTIVFTVIFGRIAGIPTNNIPPILFYLCGLIIWNYFSSNFSNISSTFILNSGIFGKVYFSRLIPPLASVVSNFFTFIFQLLIFLGFFTYFNFFTQAGLLIKPNLVYFLILPFLIIHVALLSLGVGLWVSAFTVKYRDFQFLIGFIIQLWMYITPIIYPISLIPGKLSFLVAINPMSPVVEIFKYAFFGVGYVDLRYYIFSLVITIIMFFSGVLLFNRSARNFIDTI
jgi:lipopolysaccharide transport system permease protein